MDRPLRWANIAFSMVNIRVGIYKATREERDKLRKLCKRHLLPIQQPNWCPREGRRLLGENQVVMGYEYSRNNYVVLTAEELESPEKGDKDAIPVLASHSETEIDALRLFGDLYYLAPDKPSAKAYELLVQTMKLSGHVLRVNVAIGKRRPAFIVSDEEILKLYLARNPATILPVTDPVSPEVVVSSAEIRAAAEVLELLAEPFRDEELTGEFTKLQEHRQHVIQRKLAGIEIGSEVPQQVVTGPDLLAALKRSVEAAQKKKGRPAQPQAF